MNNSWLLMFLSYLNKTEFLTYTFESLSVRVRRGGPSSVRLHSSGSCVPICVSFVVTVLIHVMLVFSLRPKEARLRDAAPGQGQGPLRAWAGVAGELSLVFLPFSS